MGRRRSYKFTDKHHSKGGIRSSIAGAIALVCTGIDIYFAYVSKGNAGRQAALFGMAAMVCCAYGTFAGSQSFKEEECYYFFSRIGTAVNLLLLIFWIAVFGMGFFM